MGRYSVLIVMVGMVLLLAVSCATSSTTTPSSISVQTPIGNASLASPTLPSSLPTSSLGVPETEVLYFPFIIPQPGIIYGSFGGVDRKLVIADGYIKAIDFRTNENDIVVFPYGYTLNTNHNPIQIQDGKGQTVAQVGDNVEMSSGGGDIEVLDLKTGKNLPREFIKGPIFPAASLQPYPFFPAYIQGYTDVTQLNSAIEATLTLNQQFIRLNTASGTSYLAIWPTGHDLRLNDGKIYIAGRNIQGLYYFQEGADLIFIGDKVIVQGGEITAVDLKKYLIYPIPEDWKGPFWIVTGIKSAN